MSEEIKCENCKWWEVGEISKAVGKCHRYPPKKYNANILHNDFYESNENDWCGEFEARNDHLRSKN